jgi:hypothetical protein
MSLSKIENSKLMDKNIENKKPVEHNLNKQHKSLETETNSKIKKSCWLTQLPFMKSLSNLSQSEKSSAESTRKCDFQFLDTDRTQKLEFDKNTSVMQTPKDLKNELLLSKNLADSLAELSENWFVIS